MDRRRFLLTTLAGALAAPLGAESQQAGKVYRIGFLGVGPGPGSWLDPFRQGLSDLGYREGRHYILEARYAEGDLERLLDLAIELVRREVDVVVTGTGMAAIAAKKATLTVPIVMMSSGDAVRQGLVVSLARPGGNVTGLTAVSPELSQKRL